MLRTLHLFLARELAKVTLMSLLAFTLVMTVFAIIEPLRKQGLSSDQVISFLGYTLPMMLSLTLPIAALFGATIVYGRLSQENEVLACRAGGIGTLTLLEPALVLGVLVTAASLFLTNWVTPQLARRAQSAVRGNIKSIVQYQLRRQGYVRYEGYILHADRVEPTPDGLVLHGMVLISATPPKGSGPRDPNVRNPWDVTVVTADNVAATFQQVAGEAFVGFHMDNPVVSRTTQYSLFQEDEAPIDSMPLKTSAKEDPAWYTWDELIDTLRNPALNTGIQQSLGNLCIDLGHEMLVSEVIAAVEANQPYTKLRGKTGPVELWAPRAERRPLEARLFAGTDASGRRVPVVVRITGARDVRVLEADRCRVTVSRSRLKNASMASLDLEGDVRFRSEPKGDPSSRPSPSPASGPAGPEDWTQREAARVGDLPMPPDIVGAMGRIDPNEVLNNVTAISSDPAVINRARSIAGRDIASLAGHIRGQIHGRLAYGLSCFLMVAMGAALGLVYRGGQLLSAFMLSMVPAAIVIVMIVMGKQMLGNYKLPTIYGMSAIWGGIAALTLGNLGLYAHLARK